MGNGTPPGSGAERALPTRASHPLYHAGFCPDWHVIFPASSSILPETSRGLWQGECELFCTCVSWSGRGKPRAEPRGQAPTILRGACEKADGSGRVGSGRCPRYSAPVCTPHTDAHAPLPGPHVTSLSRAPGRPLPVPKGVPCSFAVMASRGLCCALGPGCPDVHG